MTVGPARAFDFGLELGTLKQGNEANISVFELREEKCEFVDSFGGKRQGHQKLVNKAAVCRGQFFVNQL